MKDQNSFQHRLQDESIHLREQVEKYLKYWPWFVFSVIAALLFSFIYLRYSQPQYKSTATILVKDDRKGNLQSELSAFNDLGLMNVKNNVDNEIEIIKSRSIIEAAVKKLNFNVSFYTEGRVKTVELYEDCPIAVSFFEVNDEFYKKGQAYLISYKSDNTFELKSASNKPLGIYKYGAIIRLSNAKMVVVKRSVPYISNSKDFDIMLRISALDQVVRSYKSRVSVSPISKTTSIVELSLVDPVPQKAADLLNTIVDIYNQDAIDDKN